jgi:hypothetical protein
VLLVFMNMQVPVAHGKADIQIYRDAGAEVISVLSSAAICERASVDEAYLDVTAGAQQLLAAAAAAGGGVAVGATEQAGLGDGTEQQWQQQQQQEEAVAAGAVSHAAASGALLPMPESIDGWHVADEVGGLRQLRGLIPKIQCAVSVCACCHLLTLLLVSVSCMIQYFVC